MNQEIFGGPKRVILNGVPGDLYQTGFGECNVIVTRDPVTVRGVVVPRWHLSISHPSRYPTWDEIKQARYKLIPNEVTMAMILPPAEQFVSLHPNCFHLHEIDAEA
jgi:hypothetical protein